MTVSKASYVKHTGQCFHVSGMKSAVPHVVEVGAYALFKHPVKALDKPYHFHGDPMVVFNVD